MSLMGELILGDEVEAQPMLMRMRPNLRVQLPTRRMAHPGRAAWKTRIQAVERVTGRRRAFKHSVGAVRKTESRWSAPRRSCIDSQ